jgi:hypothetical protein
MVFQPIMTILKLKSNDKLKTVPKNTTTTKAKPKAKQTEANEDANIVYQTVTRMPKMDDLLRDSRWTKSFLPSLFHALYVSRKPFKHFKAKGPEFLNTAQNVFNLSYPDIDLSLKATDELVKKVHSILMNYN